jgi:hypothetical protein
MIGDDVKESPPLREGRVLQWFDEAFHQIDCLEMSERERVCKWVLSKVIYLMKKEGVPVHVK